jgi:hypothetical protein
MNVRVLMVLVLLIAVGLGWIVHRARVQRGAVAAIARAGGRVYYDWEVKYVPGAAVSYQPVPNSKPPWPKWLVDHLGPDYFGNVKVVVFGKAKNLVDADLAPLEKLTSLESLGLRSRLITGAGLAHLSALVRMHYLDLNYTRVTAAGLTHLRHMARLESLYLFRTPVDDLSPIRQLTGLKRLILGFTEVTNAGVAAVEGFRELSSLDLMATPVSDAGLGRMRGLTKLRSLRLNATQVSDDAIAKLQRELPSLKIVAWNRPGGVRGPFERFLLYGMVPGLRKPIATRNGPTRR